MRRDANAEQGFGDAQEDVTDAEGALFPIFVVSMLGTFLIPATIARLASAATKTAEPTLESTFV